MDYTPNNLPSDPKQLFLAGWVEVTPQAMKDHTLAREYYNPKTDMKVRFDPKTVGSFGFEGIDHYHIYNPDRTGRRDYYLDSEGHPVPKGSKAAHILPKEF